MQTTCSGPTCDNVILLTTAERTGGRCMPCVLGRTRDREVAAAEQEYILKHRQDRNAYANVTDPKRIIEIFHAPEGTNARVNWLPYPNPIHLVYAELNPVQQVGLANLAALHMNGGRPQLAEPVVEGLARFTDADLSECARVFARMGHYYPAILFAYANPEVRDQLIAVADSMAVPDHAMLCALAWIGDSVVVDKFRAWKHAPPRWASHGRFSPEDYTHYAGWEVRPDGGRRNLYLNACFGLQPGASQRPSEFYFSRIRGEPCPRCNRSLIDLFTIDLAALIPGEGIGKVTVPTCDVCSTDGLLHVYFERGSDGAPIWSPDNESPGYVPEGVDSWWPIVEDCFRMGPKRKARFPTECDNTYGLGFSQIGGLPGWEQSPQYPSCPKCALTMTFIAQVDLLELDDHGFGCFFAFLCLQCQTTATTYQRT